MELPLFPLHTVLCPGIVLPLHVFEERYRAMVGRCLDEAGAFGVVLIRDGREIGPSDLALARIGTVAAIREARRHPDGRYDLLVVGTRRFTLDGVDVGARPYLVGRVHELDEAVGDPVRARSIARQVNERFIRYVELLGADGPSVEDDAGSPPGGARARSAGEATEPAGGHPDADPDAEPDPDLDETIRRLTIPDDPTTLSYLLGGILQVEAVHRQALLEASTTEERLVELLELLEREIHLLGQGLRAYVPGPRPGRRLN